MTTFLEQLATIKSGQLPTPPVNPSEQDEEGRTLAMYFVHYLRESLPEFLVHSVDVQDSNGWTLAMHWVASRRTNIPEKLRCSPNIHTNTGKTIGMFWLIFTRQPLEDWMFTTEFDQFGNSLADYYLRFRNDDLPECLRSLVTNGRDETLAASWLRIRRTSPPDYLQCDPGHRDKLGVSTHGRARVSLKDLEELPEWLDEDDSLDCIPSLVDDPDDWAMTTVQKIRTPIRDPFATQGVSTFNT